MEPVRNTILALVDSTGPNPLLDALQSSLKDPNPDWVSPPSPKSCEFKEPIDSFEEFQAAIELSLDIFQRPALKKLYRFLTEGSDAKTSFVVVNKISFSGRHQLWHSIHAGASAAIHSVRAEFEGEPQSKKVQKYLNDIRAGKNTTQLLFSIKGIHYPLNAQSVLKSTKEGFEYDWRSSYDGWKDKQLYRSAFSSLTVKTIQEGVGDLLDLVEEQMGLDQTQKVHPWDARNLGITILQTFINVPELKSSIWRVSQSVGSHYLEHKIVSRVPAGLPQSHSGWQFFMSGAGDTTHPHIDPPLTRSLLWQVIGRKLWCTWPATNENLAKFERTAFGDRTWQWAMDKLSQSG